MRAHALLTHATILCPTVLFVPDPRLSPAQPRSMSAGDGMTEASAHHAQAQQLSSHQQPKQTGAGSAPGGGAQPPKTAVPPAGPVPVTHPADSRRLSETRVQVTDDVLACTYDITFCPELRW